MVSLLLCYALYLFRTVDSTVMDQTCRFLPDAATAEGVGAFEKPSPSKEKEKTPQKHHAGGGELC